MSRVLLIGAAVGLFSAAVVQAQDPTPEPAKDAPAAVAVTVNGKPVMESEVDEAFEGFWNQRTAGRPMPDGVKQQMRQQMRPQILDVLINDALFQELITEQQISVSDEQLIDEMKTGLRQHLARTGTTEEEFAKQLDEGMTLDQFLKERALDPEFRRVILQQRLLERRSPTELAVSPDEVAERYKRDADKVYTKPKQVKASHILLPVKPDASAEEKAAVMAKAKQLVDQAKAPGADFAALARENSTCPSRAQGGDLGYFPREGGMVEPFAAASFAMKVDEISDVVETQFGYHIIKVTGQKEASVVTLEQARDSIYTELKQEKVAKAREQLATELRQKAQITYPG
jgi:peptidyl-prolyl cis-trans isomerase C